MAAFFYILAFILLLLAFGLVLSHYMTRRQFLSVKASPADVGLAFEEVTFKTVDGLTLHGWWFPAEGSKRAVISLHGYGDSMDKYLHNVPSLHAAGFNVLLFDFRAHGRSEGKVTSLGYLERMDVLGAVEFLHKKEILRIGVIGCSMGGMVGLLSLPVSEGIDALVSDGSPARLRQGLIAGLTERRVPAWLAAILAWLMLFSTSLRLGANLFDFEPIAWVGKIAPRPILFIQGEEDQYTTMRDFESLYAAAGQGKEAWRVTGARHCTVAQQQPDEYHQRIVSFFSQNL